MSQKKLISALIILTLTIIIIIASGIKKDSRLVFTCPDGSKFRIAINQLGDEIENTINPATSLKIYNQKGEHKELTAAISASGSRYVNQNNEVWFWHDMAFITWEGKEFSNRGKLIGCASEN